MGSDSVRLRWRAQYVANKHCLETEGKLTVAYDASITGTQDAKLPTLWTRIIALVQGHVGHPLKSDGIPSQIVG